MAYYDTRGDQDCCFHLDRSTPFKDFSIPFRLFLSAACQEAEYRDKNKFDPVLSLVQSPYGWFTALSASSATSRAWSISPSVCESVVKKRSP